MNTMRFILIALISLTLALSVTLGCGENKESEDVDLYLDAVASIINQASDVAIEVSALYNEAPHLPASEIISRASDYKQDYKDLLLELMVLETPTECSQLRQYNIDAFNYCQQELTEFMAAYSTGDMDRLIEAERYYDQANQALLLAATEWDRLRGD